MCPLVNVMESVHLFFLYYIDRSTSQSTSFYPPPHFLSPPLLHPHSFFSLLTSPSLPFLLSLFPLCPPRLRLPLDPDGSRRCSVPAEPKVCVCNPDVCKWIGPKLLHQRRDSREESRGGAEVCRGELRGHCLRQR